MDANNHALAALRYLISRLDAHRLARGASGRVLTPPGPERPWLRLDNEALW